ncbi:uncharacterized protein [Patagioenas fasciata]|uniref:uncharacterized protein isoform X5 n=1 Tax=Patagioenas fasciata TaxID=372321 RepID=UPI003A9A2896
MVVKVHHGDAHTAQSQPLKNIKANTGLAAPQRKMKVAVLSVALLFTILLCTPEDAQAFPGTLLEASGGSLLHLPLSLRVDDVLQQKHQVPDLPDAEVLVHPSPPLLVSSIRASPAPQRVLGGQNVDLEANRGDCPCPVSQAMLDRAAPMTFGAPSGALRTQRVTVQARLGLWGLTDPKDHPEGWAGFWEM